MLTIEYQYVRIYTNSVGMQAVVERTLAETDTDVPQDDILPMNLEPRDYDFIQEVVDGSCQILQKVVQLSESGALRYSPVRIFLRITTSSIYLIKGLSLGSRNQKLQSSLDILDAAIRALRASTFPPSPFSHSHPPTNPPSPLRRPRRHAPRLALRDPPRAARSAPARQLRGVLAAAADPLARHVRRAQRRLGHHGLPQQPRGAVCARGPRGRRLGDDAGGRLAGAAVRSRHGAVWAR